MWGNCRALGYRRMIYQARPLRTMRRGGVLVSLLQLQPGVADQAAQLGVGVQVLLTEADRGGRARRGETGLHHWLTTLPGGYVTMGPTSVDGLKGAPRDTAPGDAGGEVNVA
jgi:hypothetical protein